MSENFLKFKRKSKTVRALRSLMGAAAAGMLAAGVFLLLSRLALIEPEPIFALPVGAAAAVIAAIAVFIAMRRSDSALAKRLDRSFGLEERVETMLAYRNEEGAILDMQREDTDRRLAAISVGDFKTKGLWAFVTALCVGAVTLLAGFLVPSLRDYEPPEEVIPFELTDMQRAGIGELIAYVESSAMEEPYRSEISAELGRLLARLEETETQPDMQAALAEAMAYIMTATYNSSSMTEIANALWNGEDEYTQMLARVINTGSWREPDWGDYAEKYSEFRLMYDHSPAEGETEHPSEEELFSELKWKIQRSSLKFKDALSGSGIEASDALYAVIDRFLSSYGSEEGGALGLDILSTKIDGMSYADATEALRACFDAMTDPIYEVISQQKVNTNVGEYTMTKLSSLFLVPLPGFERPDFVKNGDTGVSGSDSDGEDDRDENESEGGGIGTGATYGSNDLVLDPLTGEYVEYGTLLDKYYSVMDAKLSGGGYTEHQKEAIKKYFALLYGGIKKDEGN